ncbi:MAG: redoxin domain-containing protein [Myxococcales bacterium]|nr:redoxin domain-containing protein [Myxococcales bacterium]
MRFVLAVGTACLLAACETVPGAAATDAGAPPPEDAATGIDAGTGLLDGGFDAGGLDAGLTATDAGSPAPAICPPVGPFGNAVGDVAPDLVLMDCDGNPHSLHELCEDRAVWLFEYADWCPPCRDFASREANRIYDRFAAGGGFEAYLVISENSSFGEPDADVCAAVRDRYGIHMPVLFDPGTAFEDTFGVASNEVQIVLRDGARIEWKGHYAGDMVEARIEATLAP